MTQARVSIENMEGFDHQIEAVIDAINQHFKEIATVAYNEAKTTLEFDDSDDTGNLRNSIRLKKSKFEGGGFIVRASGRGKDMGYHAANVEFGHVLIAWGHPTGKRVKPHPFMRKAQEAALRKAMELFK